MLPILLLVTYVSTQCLTGNDSPLTMNVGSKKAVINSRFGFALDTLKKMSQIESRDNIFYSPHSLHQALTLAYFGARGTTENSLRKALHLSDDVSKVDVQRYYAYENSFKNLDDQVSRIRATLHHYCSCLQVFQGEPHNRNIRVFLFNKKF